MRKCARAVARPEAVEQIAMARRHFRDVGIVMTELAEELEHLRLQTLPNAEETPLRAQLENESMKFEVEQDGQIPIVRKCRTLEPVDDGLQQLDVLGVVAVE